MASDSQHDSDAARPPINTHPAFPAVVALWFAALLGLGSLVVPVALLERAVVAIGIASFAPAASPPLGLVARGLIAVVMAFVGVAIGVSIGRRLAQSDRSMSDAGIAKLAGSRRPLNIKEELGGEGVFNGAILPTGYSRTLVTGGERSNDAVSSPPVEFGLSPMLAGDEIVPDFDEDAAVTDQAEFQPVSPFERFDETAQEFEATEARASPEDLPDPVEPEPLAFSPPSLARRAPMADTDAALRAALTALQNVRGAA